MTMSFLILEIHHWPLENYIKSVFDPDLVKLYRAKRPLGLIACRQWGATLSRGDAIVVLDTHMEVREGWCVTRVLPCTCG